MACSRYRKNLTLDTRRRVGLGWSAVIRRLIKR
jgi:hypothetical protein